MEPPTLTAAQARRMRSAARFYAVQALFQMEAADAGLETVLEEFETHRLGRRDRRRRPMPSPTSRISARC